MARRGWRVVVYTASRGYDDPTVTYPRRENIDGVEVIRLPFSSLGKGSMGVRLLGQVVFLVQAVVRAMFVKDVGCLLVTTAPPIASAAGWFLSVLRRLPVTYWVMDLNPDQVVRMGLLPARSLPVRVFEFLNRLILNRASHVVALDRFMAELVRRKVDVSHKMFVVPPWPLEHHLEPVARDENRFRKRHGLEGKVVVMYSGNHSPANPLATILAAAERLKSDSRFAFAFVGGGKGKREVEEAIARGAINIFSFPYQRLEDLGESLSAGDIHVVSVGDAVVGVVHPCKIYGAMAVGRPVLTLGPAECHLADLVDRFAIGFHVAHGDVDAAVKALVHLAGLPAGDLAAMGRRGRDGIERELTQASLRAKVCDVLELC